VVLLTRHAHDINRTLTKHRLQSLFDEVIHIDQTAKKSDFIVPEGAIFIDDSFRERMDVSRRHNIPTFDSSMLELLIDERA
jgi:hypothetical protein